MALRKDIRRPAIVEAPIEAIIARGSVDGLPLHWPPSMPPLCFLAEP